DLETFSHKSGVLAQHSADVGRDAADIARSAAWPGPEQAEGFVAAGASLFTVGVSGPDYDLTEVAQAIDWRDARTAGCPTRRPTDPPAGPPPHPPARRPTDPPPYPPTYRPTGPRGVVMVARNRFQRP